MAPTELDDLQQEPDLPAGTLTFQRDARLFATRRALAAQLAQSRRRLLLVSDELLQLPVPADVVVRRGNLRITELLADGREVTRAVLQAGATCCTRDADATGSQPGDEGGAGLYRLRDMILMALGDTEVWLLAAGTLDGRD